ncbi:MAG: hypothetical protein JSS86_12235 [Cyanobacteria bacterium SZAS LIN-2]|nr:hypothetical protein [Cyanobacteria bacterium SZAS LIN-2]
MSMFKFTSMLLVSTATLVGANFAHADDPDPTHDGWVSHVQDHRIEICYQDGLPAVGQTVQIFRVSYVTYNKAFFRQQFRPAGEARITASSSDRCVVGELTAGTVERTDHARQIAAVAPR